MTVPKMRRLGALVAVCGGAAIAGCSPSLGSIGMTSPQMDSIVASLSWVGCDTVARVGEGGPTDVEICAAPGIQQYGPNDPPGGGAAPVARMRNLGGTVEARWRLLANGSVYHIWLHSGGGKTGFTILGPGAGPNRTGAYHGCKHQPANAARASFGTCDDRPWPPPLAGRARNGFSRASAPDDRGMKFEHRLLAPETGPAWLTCREGCCTTGAT